MSCFSVSGIIPARLPSSRPIVRLNAKRSKTNLRESMNHKRTQFSVTVAVAATCLCAVHLQAQLTIVPSTFVLPASVADTNQPGFFWNVSQVANSEPNQLVRAQGQLARLEGNNLADQTAVGIAA